MKYLPCLLYDGSELVYGLRPEHGDARLAEVGYALEDRCRGEVAAGMNDATPFVDALHVDTEELEQQVYLLVSGER